MLQLRDKTRRRRILAAVGALIVGGASSDSFSATKTWDLIAAGANNGVIDNPGGTWNTSLTLNWTTDGGATNTTWASNDDAIFGGNPGVGSAGSIVLSGTINANSITFNPSAGSFALSGGSALNLTGAGGLITTNADASIGSAIGGSAGLTKAGSDTLTLTGANTVSGAVVVNSGTLDLSGASGALTSASSYTINAGAGLLLDNTGATNSDRIGSAAINMNGGTINFVGAAGLTENAGNLFCASGANVVAISGGGTPTTFALGTFNRSAGAIVNFTGGSSSRRISFSNLTLDSFAGAYAYANGSSFAWYDAAGYIRPMAYGTDVNTSTGMASGRHVRLITTQISSGITILSLNIVGAVNLTFSNNTVITISSGGIIKSGGGAGAIQGGNESLTYGWLTTGSPAAEWIMRTNDPTDALTIAKLLTGGTALTKSGFGTLILGHASNTYSGTTTIAEGTLQIGIAEAVPNTSPLVVGNGAAFDLNGKTETIANLTVRGGASVSSVAPATLVLDSSSGTITGAATSDTGTIDVNTIWLANSNVPAVHTINVADGEAAVDLDIGSLIQNGVASAQGIDKTGAGTLRLGAVNAYTGVTSVSGGTLQLDGSTALASTVAVGNAGTLSGSGTVNGNATLTGNGVINFSPGGAIAGTLGIAGGNWNGAGSVTGTTTVSSGTFTVGGTLGGAGPLNVESTATLAGGGTVNKTVNVNSGGAISPAGAGSAAQTGAIAASNVNLNPGSAYVWEIKDVSGPAGGGYDTINVSGTLNINAGTTAGTQVTIHLVAYPGQLQNWNSQGIYVWDVAIAGTVSGFTSAQQFVLDTSGFEDDYPRDGGRYFDIDTFGNRLRIHYVPEPSSAALIGVAAMGLLKRRRR